MRVLHVAYKQLRRYGKTHGNWVEKLAFGMIKNDHHLFSFSDRDTAAYEAPWGLRDLGWRKANQRLLEMVEATEPELVVLGHCDKITDTTVREIRRMRPQTLLAHVNCDALFVPKNFENLKQRAQVVDAMFVTTGRRDLKPLEGLGARIYHIPNPVDPSMETMDNSQKSGLDIDLLFCSSGSKFSTRGVITEYIRERLEKNICFKTPGSFGESTVWGRDYDHILARTRMALNLNRQEGDYWYSSDRMAQLAGNGILQFTSARQGFDDLLPQESMVYFKDNDDLLEKIREFHYDEERRSTWASRCREFFHKEINSTLYAQYIVEATTGLPLSHDYVWARDIHPDGSLK